MTDFGGKAWTGLQGADALSSEIHVGTVGRPYQPVSRRHVLAGAPALLLGLSGLRAQTPAPPLNFLVVGDWGRDGKHYQFHVARQMALEAKRLDGRFIVSTGDNFYNLGVSGDEDKQWETSFENIYVEPELQIPWYVTLGNHDYGGDVGAQVRRTGRRERWRLPMLWHEARYSVGPTEVQLLFLDTVSFIGKESFPYGWLGSPIASGVDVRQRDWLIQKLAEPGPDVRLVFGHHPIYSVGPHGGQFKLAKLDEILRAGGATAYICGHDHCLYHIEHAGMHYICSGGGSKEMSDFRGDPATWACVLPGDCGDNRPIWRDYVGRAGFAAFSVGADASLRFRFIDRDGYRSRARLLKRGTPSVETDWAGAPSMPPVFA